MTANDHFEDFRAGFDFALDDFQIKACHCLAAGHSVLVAAPTGAGKTVVGEFAAHLGLSTGKKCFYTTPIKALSNQKYHDLAARYGSDAVGLLTGDQSVNSNAPVVVMTTEVLRNMIYAGSTALTGLGYVVMDEVHYLADRFRGAVWEEVILGLAPSVCLVALSATVSNAEEFGEWLNEVRGEVDLVVSEKRPVPLFQHVLVGRRLNNLFVGDAIAGTASTKVNPELISLAKQEARFLRDDSRASRSRHTRGRIAARNSGRGRDLPTTRLRPPRRDGAVEALHDRKLLPAIFFVFSRQGCDQAVGQIMGSGIVLTTQDEARQLTEIAERHGAVLGNADRRVLGWDGFCSALIRGIAAHHAGLLPVFKAIVEEGFARGLIKVVFATETLALGINMPARTVVIEKLVKYNGETHVEITPGEYTQLTGRAGRRGIDVEGHAVVFWQPGMDPRQVAGLASRRTYPLRSSFTPNYNMAVNLVASVGRVHARAMLEQSFAQFQTDRKVVTWARQAARFEEQTAGLWQRAACSLGDFREYAMLREQIREMENEASRLRRLDRATEIAESLTGLEAGDVFWIPAGKHLGWAVVVCPGNGTRGPLVMTATHQLVIVSVDDLNAVVRTVSRIRIPKRMDVHSAADRRRLANSLDGRISSLGDTHPASHKLGADARMMEAIAELRAEMKAHPCHRCPDREIHTRFAEEAVRADREFSRTRIKQQARANSIATRFDRICGVLDGLGYLEGDRITQVGRLLSRIYNELDLLVAEAVRAGLFDGLDIPQLAAVLSSLVYESRIDGEPAHRMPDAGSEAAQSQLRRLWIELGRIERDNRVERGPAPDIGFASAAYAWAGGATLAQVLEETRMPAGDFVRWVRQVIDLASQISNAPGAGTAAETCRGVINAMRRDIVDLDTG